MNGVVLAGGLGTRLYPLTHATNKHLFPVYDRPMVFYPIQTLVKAGIDEILLVIGGPHAGHFIRVLKNGKDLGLKHLEFAYQEREGGISDALLLAEDFADEDNVAVILGDNCTDADIKKEVKHFKKGALLFFKQVSDPHRFGVGKFDKNNKLISIIEKPHNPPSDYAQTGLYIYDNTVFKKIKTLIPSKRGELEITDLYNIYLWEGSLQWNVLEGYWRDAGTFSTLFEANKYWATKRSK